MKHAVLPCLVRPSEVILHAGPIFVGEDYQCRRRLVAFGETPKAEFRRLERRDGEVRGGKGCFLSNTSLLVLVGFRIFGDVVPLKWPF